MLTTVVERILPLKGKHWRLQTNKIVKGHISLSWTPDLNDPPFKSGNPPEVQFIYVFSSQNQRKSKRNCKNIYFEVYFPSEKQNKAIKIYKKLVFL